MRFRCLAICILGALVVHSTAAAQATATLPSAEEIGEKFVEVTGGADAYKALKSRVVKGKMLIKEAGVGGELIVTTGSGGKAFSEITITGIGKERMGADGTTYWSLSAFTGNRILEGAEKALHVLEHDLQAALHPEKYYKEMKVTGIEKLGEEDCYRVEKTQEDGGTKVDLYSVETGLMLKSAMPVDTPLGKINVETLVSDYRKVGDMMVSFKSETKLPGNMTQVITLEKVELNPEVSPELFELPEEIKQLKAKQEKAAAP